MHATTPNRLDATDVRILKELRRNARISYRDLGAKVGLSANAVTQRMRRMESAKVIRGYTVLIDPELEGPALQALVHVHTTVDVDTDKIEAEIAKIPAVVEVLDLAGSIDYEIRLRARTQGELYEAVNTMRRLNGVVDIETRPVLRPVMRR